MTPTHCTTSLGYASVWWTASKNYIARHLARLNSFCFASARSNEQDRPEPHDHTDIIRVAGCLTARSPASSPHHCLDDRRGRGFSRDRLQLSQSRATRFRRRQLDRAPFGGRRVLA